MKNEMSAIAISKLLVLITGLITVFTFFLPVYANSDTNAGTNADTDLRIDSRYLQTEITSSTAITAARDVHLFTDEENQKSLQMKKAFEEERQRAKAALFEYVYSQNELSITEQLALNASMISFENITAYKSSGIESDLRLPYSFIIGLLVVCALSGFLLASRTQKKRAEKNTEIDAR